MFSKAEFLYLCNRSLDCLSKKILAVKGNVIQWAWVWNNNCLSTRAPFKWVNLSSKTIENFSCCYIQEYLFSILGAWGNLSAFKILSQKLVTICFQHSGIWTLGVLQATSVGWVFCCGEISSVCKTTFRNLKKTFFWFEFFVPRSNILYIVYLNILLWCSQTYVWEYSVTGKRVMEEQRAIAVAFMVEEAGRGLTH